MMKRRDFLKTAAAAAISAPLTFSAGQKLFAEEKPARWYKGNFHCHSQWSDGKDLPEIVVDAYKNRGYEFFCLSDHNVIQKENLRFDGFAMNFTPKDLKPFEGQTSFWKRVSAEEGWPNLTEKHLQYARDRFGADSVTSIETNEGKYVRMKTFKELQEQFAEPDRFLMIPGFEMTSQWIHVNCVNVEEAFFMEDPDSQALVGRLWDKAQELYADWNQPWLFTVNHPLWQYYNIQPSTLIGRPELRFLELTNNSHDPAYPDPEGVWTPESFFDVVNAHRASHGQLPLYSTGTDDSHGIFRKDCLPFLGWMYIRSQELNFPSLLEAMYKGDAFCSTGLEFEEISFDGKTLAVKINPKEEGEYRIEFVGTKKDYDPSFKIIDVPGEGSRPERHIESYSPEIGKVLETADGLEASYTLKSDDLYVRAKAYRVGAGRPLISEEYGSEYVAKDAAWTQAYFA